MVKGADLADHFHSWFFEMVESYKDISVKLPSIWLEIIDNKVMITQGNFERKFLVEFMPDREIYKGRRFKARLPRNRSGLGFSITASSVQSSVVPQLKSLYSRSFLGMEETQIISYNKMFGDPEHFLDIRENTSSFDGIDHAGVRVASPILPKIYNLPNKEDNAFRMIKRHFLAPMQEISFKSYGL